MGGISLNYNLKKLEDELIEVERELEKLPKGYLVKRRNFLVHRLNGKETGVTKDVTSLKQLARQRYLIKRAEEVNSEIKQIDKKKRTLFDVVNGLPKAYHGLSIDKFYHSDIEPWLARVYKKMEFHDEQLNYQSKNGTKLRSKSELFIANLLEEYELPYRYEIPLSLGGKTKYPDFMIRHPFSGRIFVWEHFGAFDKDNYVQSMDDKMKLYLQHGFRQFDNLIYTFEFDLLNGEQRVRELIEDVILR